MTESARSRLEGPLRQDTHPLGLVEAPWLEEALSLFLVKALARSIGTNMHQLLPAKKKCSFLSPQFDNPKHQIGFFRCRIIFGSAIAAIAAVGRGLAAGEKRSCIMEGQSEVKVGMCVLIHGLETRKDLNDRWGEVLKSAMVWTQSVSLSRSSIRISGLEEETGRLRQSGSKR